MQRFDWSADEENFYWSSFTRVELFRTAHEMCKGKLARMS